MIPAKHPVKATGLEDIVLVTPKKNGTPRAIGGGRETPAARARGCHIRKNSQQSAPYCATLHQSAPHTTSSGTNPQYSASRAPDISAFLNQLVKMQNDFLDKLSWGKVYSFFLIKFFVWFLKKIKLKTDISHFMNEKTLI